MNLLQPLIVWKSRHVSSSILLMILASGTALAQISDTPFKQGLWESTVSSTIQMSLPPEMEARIAALPAAQQAMMKGQMGGGKPVTSTNKGCLAKQESMESMLNEEQQKSGAKCTFTNKTQTATGGSFDTTCTTLPTSTMPASTLQGHTDVLISGDDHFVATTHLTGTTTVNGSAVSLTADTKIDSKYLGADCGDVKPAAQ